MPRVPVTPTMKLVELVRSLPADPGSFALLDAIPIGIFIVGADGATVFTNSAATELLGREIQPGTTAEERAGFFRIHVAGTGAFYPPDRLPSVRALKGEHVRVMDMELRLPDRMIIVDCASAPIVDAGGKVVGSITTFSDITDVARIERAYQILLQNVPVGFYSVKPDGTFLVANPALRRILGYEPDGDLQQGNLENDHVKRQEHLVFRHQLEERGEVRGFETTWRRRDGNVVHVSLNATCTRDDTGAMVSYEGTVEDISDRKRTNEEAREARERYRQLVENANDIIYRTDAYGKFTYVNPTVRKILGYTEQELIGRHFTDLIAPDHRAAAGKFYQVQFQTKKPNTYFEFPVIAKNGEIVWMGQHVQIVITGQWILGFQSVSRDISERKRMETELAKARDAALESARLKSEFLANMSHEIRTPMNGVIGMADILLGTRLTAEQKESAITIRRSAEALLTLVDDILDLAKIEAGKLTIKNTNFDLDELIDAITDVFAERAAAKGLKFRAVVYPDVHRHLNGDALRVRQVLLNLVGNAVKFTESGEVSVSVMRESDTADATELWFLVNDTGIGITQADQDRLFTPFTQADGSTTRRFGGTGLGLVISKQLVDLMGGRIGVASVPSEGSTFWFTGRFTKDLAGEKTSRQGMLSGVRALLLDSNELNRLVLRRHLTASSIHVEEVASAEAAIDALRNARSEGRPFDAIVLEMQLTSTDGISVARTIHADPLIRDTPIVLVTAIGRRKSDIEFFKAEGIDSFVTKPVRRAQLTSALMSVVAGASARIPAAVGGRHHTEAETKPTRRQILIVEDNVVNQKVAVGQLRNLGYDADVAGSGSEALEVIRNQAYDLIFLDCQMPDVDGYDVARTIRSMETAGQHVPIVAMTAHTMDGEREKCLAAGMDDFLTKPVSLQRLGGVLVRWLGAREDVVDMEKMAGLQQLAKANPSFMRDITALFREDALVRLHELRDSLGGASPDRVARAAHSLKSSSGNIGASRMYSLCATIESTARQGSLDGVAEMVEQLASELDRALAALAQSADSTDA